MDAPTTAGAITLAPAVPGTRVIRNSVDTRPVRAALDSLSAALSTDDLAQLNIEVTVAQRRFRVGASVIQAVVSTFEVEDRDGAITDLDTDGVAGRHITGLANGYPVTHWR